MSKFIIYGNNLSIWERKFLVNIFYRVTKGKERLTKCTLRSDIGIHST